MGIHVAHRTILKVFAVAVCLLVLSGAALAQTNGPSVTVLNVDDAGFPELVAHVTARDGDGFPLAGLSAADVTVLEDGTPVPTEDVSVHSTAIRNVRLVLAVDTSVSEEDLAAIKPAALALLDSLRPTDRLALLTFHDESSVRQAFTNNTEVLRTAVEGLTSEGSLTVLHAAAVDAAQLAAEADGYPIVILLTNSNDNAESLARDEMLATLSETGVPVHTIGFGPQVAPDVLAAMSEETGGSTFTLADAASFESVVRSLAVLVRQSYTVRFTSGLTADGATHDLAIGLTYRGTEVQGETTFTATPGEVSVTVPTLSDGETIVGNVELAVDASAPAPIASVTYLLDGETLATRTEAPFSYEWDSTTAEPGAHTLTVEVKDSAGNQARTEVAVDVEPPLAVTAALSRQEITLGDEAVVEAHVDAPEGVEAVHFLVDGELRASDDTPPYSFVLDSSDYELGERTITVRAEDALGRTSATTLAARLIAPTRPSTPLWQRRPVLLLLALTTMLVSALILHLILDWQRRIRRRVFGLDLENTGNVTSRFELRGVDPSGALDLRFTLNGVPLRRQARTEPRETASPATTAHPTPARMPQPATGAGGAAGGTANAGTSESESGSGTGLRERAGGVMQRGGTIVNIINSATQVLPRSVRGPIMQALRPVYSAQMQTRRAQVHVSSVKSAGRQAGQLPGMVGMENDGQREEVDRAPATASNQRASPQSPADVPTRPAPVAAATDARASATWWQTPPVEPGETLTLQALVDPGVFRTSQQYTFKILSRPTTQEEVDPVTTEGRLDSGGTSWIRHYLPFLVFMIVTALAGWVTAVLLAGAGMLA